MDGHFWEVTLSPKARKAMKKLKEHPGVSEKFVLLLNELETKGPIRANWPHFNSLDKQKGIPDNCYHCHIKRGRPNYVVCWYIISELTRKIEIFYVGTHEKAPY